MNQRLRHILGCHLDPNGGSPYWLMRQQQLEFDIRERIRTLNDLWQLGPFDQDHLRTQPITDFIPRSLFGKCRLITGETGGATGQAKTTAYFEDEFEAAFVTPFFETTGWRRHACTGQWLWLGPSGPHIIGKAARRIALDSTRCDGFSVDFDPRWFRRLTPGSIARSRYFDHLIEQAQHIVATQSIRYLFTTPVVLEALAERLSGSRANAVELIYLGGMSVSAAVLQALGEVFSNALFLSGYGNTLFGVCHEQGAHRPDENEPCYSPPPAGRIAMDLVSLDESVSDAQRLRMPVATGEIGQVVMHRFDESFFLPNVLERDRGRRINTGGIIGIQHPQPIQKMGLRVENGIY